MIEIIYITKDALRDLKDSLGERAIKSEATNEGEGLVTLSENVIMKAYGFDNSIQLDLGGRLYSLSKEDYWKIEIS